MATSSVTSPVTRETNAYVRQKGLRALVVTVRGPLLELRPKGTRQTETVDLAAVWQGAVKARVWQAKMEKAKARKARRK